MSDLPEELGFNQNNISKAELSYIEQGFYDYKKEIGQYHKLPQTAETLETIIAWDENFIKGINTDLNKLSNNYCNNCPYGYTLDNCKAKSCPIKTIKSILDSHINILKQNRPGGIQLD